MVLYNVATIVQVWMPHSMIKTQMQVGNDTPAGTSRRPSAEYTERDGYQTRCWSKVMRKSHLRSTQVCQELSQIQRLVDLCMSVKEAWFEEWSTTTVIWRLPNVCQALISSSSSHWERSEVQKLVSPKIGNSLLTICSAAFLFLNHRLKWYMIERRRRGGVRSRVFMVIQYSPHDFCQWIFFRGPSSGLEYDWNYSEMKLPCRVFITTQKNPWCSMWHAFLRRPPGWS